MGEELTVEFNVEHLHIENPLSGCNIAIFFEDDYIFDPGIGQMVVGPTTDAAFFRVRPYPRTDIFIFDQTFDITFN